MNTINRKKITKSIEMKEKWIKNIFKKSRKLSSLDKFWNLVIEELGFLHFNDFDFKCVFISEEFLAKLKEADMDNASGYEKFSPRTCKDIDREDYSVYITEGYNK